MTAYRIQPDPIDPAPEVSWSPRRPARCYAGTCQHRQHDGIANPRRVPIDPALPSAVAAVDHTIAQGGGTFRIGDSGRLILHTPSTGYAIGVHAGTFRTVALGNPWTRDDAAAAILAARDQSRAYGAGYVGTWIDAADLGHGSRSRSIMHVDPVTILADRALALRVARGAGQQAIWSFADGESINVDPEPVWSGPVDPSDHTNEWHAHLRALEDWRRRQYRASL